MVAIPIISRRRMLCGMKEEKANHLILTTTGSCLIRSEKRKPKYNLPDAPSCYYGSLDCSVLPCEHIQTPYASCRSPSECTLSCWGCQLHCRLNIYRAPWFDELCLVIGMWTSIAWIFPISTKARTVLMGILWHLLSPIFFFISFVFAVNL